MNNLKLGLIGCGKQAEKHIQSLQKIPGVEIVIADVSPRLAEKLAAGFHTSWVENPNDIFGMGDLEGVLICTPTPSHAQLIEKSLLNGKHVFCEKPLCSNMREAIHLKETEITSGCLVIVGYLYRYVPTFEIGWRLLYGDGSRTNAVLGKPNLALFRIGGRGSHQIWKHRKDQGGGAISEMLVHMVDLANWYFGPISNIEVLSNQLKCPERLIQGKKETVDAEDYVLIQAKGRDGVEIVCQADLITPAFNQYVEIQCDNGSFMGSILRDMPSWVFLNKSCDGYPSGKTILHPDGRSFLDIQMEYFYQCVTQQQKADRNRIDDSIELMNLIESIRKE